MVKKKAAGKKASAKSKPLSKRSSVAPKVKVASRAKADTGDFAPTFAALRKCLAAFAPELRVIADEPNKYSLATQAHSWRGGPMFFASVNVGKAYVSYHLMPIYIFPELKKKVSASLDKRMQGKACFNFKHPDTAVISDLSAVTGASLEKYRAKNLLLRGLRPAGYRRKPSPSRYYTSITVNPGVS
jgi:hypothetical protein